MLYEAMMMSFLRYIHLCYYNIDTSSPLLHVRFVSVNPHGALNIMVKVNPVVNLFLAS